MFPAHIGYTRADDAVFIGLPEMFFDNLGDIDLLTHPSSPHPFTSEARNPEMLDLGSCVKQNLITSSG